MFGTISYAILIGEFETGPLHWIVRLFLILSGVIGTLFVFLIVVLRAGWKITCKKETKS